MFIKTIGLKYRKGAELQKADWDAFSLVELFLAVLSGGFFSRPITIVSLNFC